MGNYQIDIKNAPTYEDLPTGTYEGQIDKFIFREPRVEGKFPQVMATYLVTDGEHVGRKSSEFVSLSPKAAGRVATWLKRFGEYIDLDQIDAEGFEYDEDTMEITNVDVVGLDVLFRVKRDGVKFNSDPPEPRYTTELVEVLGDGAAPSAEETPAAPAEEPAEEEKPKATPRAAAAAKPRRRQLR
jgi:hypothetical protein